MFIVILSLVRDHNRFAYLDKGTGKSKKIVNRNAKSVAHIFFKLKLQIANISWNHVLSMHFLVDLHASAVC